MCPYKAQGERHLILIGRWYRAYCFFGVINSRLCLVRSIVSATVFECPFINNYDGMEILVGCGPVLVRSFTNDD